MEYNIFNLEPIHSEFVKYIFWLAYILRSCAICEEEEQARWDRFYWFGRI